MAYNCCASCGDSLGADDSTHKLCVRCEDRERTDHAANCDYFGGSDGRIVKPLSNSKPVRQDVKE